MTALFKFNDVESIRNENEEPNNVEDEEEDGVDNAEEELDQYEEALDLVFASPCSDFTFCWIYRLCPLFSPKCA